MKTSHQYAHELRALADHLLERPAFDVRHGIHNIMFDSKAEIASAIKALGSGRKSFGDYWFEFTPAFTNDAQDVAPFRLSTTRSNICTKVQEAVWQCDPLFAEDEESLTSPREAS